MANLRTDLQDLRAGVLPALGVLGAAPERMAERPTGSGTESQWPAGEFAVCKDLATRCVFVVGFARSNTSITQVMLNSARDAFLLGEANFYLPRPGERFRDSYNAQHVAFGNQTTKSTYAPDFVPNGTHTWWEWLAAAADRYAVVGDKIALSSYQFRAAGVEGIQPFFETRFFESKYVFLFRDPIDTLLSLMKLVSRTTDRELVVELDAWLRFVQMWADWVRIFPNTLTLIADEFGPETVTRLATFTGLSLAGADVLLNEKNKRVHTIPDEFPTLAAQHDELIKIFNLIKAATSERPPLWQAVQKRTLEENDTRGGAPGQTAMVPMALGQAWALADHLRKTLELP